LPRWFTTTSAPEVPGTGRRYNGYSWNHVRAVTVTTPNYSEYKILLDQPAPMVMICCTGDGPARDDVFIDAVKGCAVQP
jgi:hypothetical protein